MKQLTTSQLEIDDRLNGCKAVVLSRLKALPHPFPAFKLFFSVSDGTARARVVSGAGGTPDDAWQQGVLELSRVMNSAKLEGRWIRIDWVTSVKTATWLQMRAILKQVKRNYFRLGLALDERLNFAFTEQEINANAMFYGGNSITYAIVNESNFSLYARTKYPKLDAPLFKDEDELFVLSTEGVFSDEDGMLHDLIGSGGNAGRRSVENLASGDVLKLIEDASTYLAHQVQADGSFIYGYHPCFDRRIDAYNTLRHASTTYSMIEAWEVTQDSQLRAAIDRSLDHLTNTLIRTVILPSGDAAAFLVDVGDEIKLGANAVAILALAKYSQVTRSEQYLPLAALLATGIQFMQDRDDGSFVHVLNAHDLSVKERFRTIYYDGEAAFGLMRLFELTRDPQLLETVERAFEHFIASNHWEHHDHWLSYCVNELTRYRPDERYFRFGIQNFVGYLDFVLERITTFPTLLELMMAAEGMISRIRQRPEYLHLLDGIDLEKFYRALNARAHYLLNGHFWPEMAMYYRNPNRIVGSFFIRHHGFRVRIDDVEHYLSGFIAYRKFLLREGTPAVALQEGGGAPRARKPADPLSIGLLMYPASPKGFPEVRRLAEKAATNGLRVFYASYKDTRIVDGKMNGYAFEKGRWKKADFDVPAIIDNAPPRTKRETALFTELSSGAFLTSHKLGGKQKTLHQLGTCRELGEWLIPSTVLSGENLEAALNEDGKVIAKPFRSSRGRGVYLLQKQAGGTVLARTNDAAIEMGADAFQTFVKQRSNGNWMLQKYVASVDAGGRAFDIRVPLLRSREGVWKIARIYARLGAGDITSNLATGGTNHDAVPFLSEIYGEETARSLVKTLEHASQKIADALQRNYPFVIDALGCDFGVANGRAYLFEVNSYPGMKGCLETATDLKAEYYETLSRAWRKADGMAIRNVFEAPDTPDRQRPFPDELAVQQEPLPIAIEAATEANRALLQKVMEQGENDFSKSEFLKPGMGNPVYALIASEARRRGYKSKIVNNTHLELRDDYGVAAVFSPNSPDLSCVPREVMANKELTKAILQQAGLPVPGGASFTDYAPSLEYLLNRDCPQVVKPVRGYGGIGVTTGVVTEQQFHKAWQRACRVKQGIVIEDFIVGDELRLIVLNGETVAAVCRVPAYVIGDGVSKISQLVEIKNARRDKNPLMRVYPIRQFDYLENELGLGRDHVPARGKFVRLATVSNVGLGGEAVSMVDVLHPSFLNLARRAFDALPGATQIGLDVIARDFGADAFDDNAKIIEVNSDPAIGTPRFVAYGPPAAGIAAKLLDFVERKSSARTAVTHPEQAIIEAAPAASSAGGLFRGTHGLQVKLLRDAATRRGMDINALSADVTIVSWRGKKRLFWLGMSDRTSMAARRASRSREWSGRLLRAAGLEALEQHAFGPDDFDLACSFAVERGWHVSIKPAFETESQAPATQTGSLPGFQAAWKLAVESGASRILVEPNYSGTLYRLFVVENRLVAVARRRAAPTSGSEIVDETEQVHPDWAAIAVMARKAVFDPFHIGVDLIAQDMAKAPGDQAWLVAGVKVNPEFGIHHFPVHGQGRDVAGAFLERLFD